MITQASAICCAITPTHASPFKRRMKIGNRIENCFQLRVNRRDRVQRTEQRNFSLIQRLQHLFQRSDLSCLRPSGLEKHSNGDQTFLRRIRSRATHSALPALACTLTVWRRTGPVEKGYKYIFPKRPSPDRGSPFDDRFGRQQVHRQSRTPDRGSSHSNCSRKTHPAGGAACWIRLSPSFWDRMQTEDRGRWAGRNPRRSSRRRPLRRCRRRRPTGRGSRRAGARRRWRRPVLRHWRQAGPAPVWPRQVRGDGGS